MTQITSPISRFVVLPLLLTLVAVSPAIAQDAPAAPPSNAVDARRAGDAAADRNILLPSAEVGPAGEITFNSYELVLAGLTYGFTDHTQVSLTVLLPITSDFPFFGTLALKHVLLRSSATVFSVMPTLTFLSDSDTDLSVGSFGAGLLVDRMLDGEGRFVLSGSLFTHFGFGSGGTDADFSMAEGAIFYMSGAFNARLGRHVKLLTELILPGAYSWAGPTNEFEIVQEALLFGYGLRFFGSSIGVDLTFLRPIHPDVDTGSLVMGLPWVAFSGRF